MIAASSALLALLGTGPHADLLAHLFGFLLVGHGLYRGAHDPMEPAGAGPVAARRRRRGGVIGAWRMAF